MPKEINAYKTEMGRLEDEDIQKFFKRLVKSKALGTAEIIKNILYKNCYLKRTQSSNFRI